jgi:hypothetical protein
MGASAPAALAAKRAGVGELVKGELSSAWDVTVGRAAGARGRGVSIASGMTAVASSANRIEPTISARHGVHRHSINRETAGGACI